MFVFRVLAFAVFVFVLCLCLLCGLCLLCFLFAVFVFSLGVVFDVFVFVVSSSMFALCFEAQRRRSRRRRDDRLL